MKITGIRINGVDAELALDGKSAYELAVDHGFEGTEEEWLASLHGAEGPQGEPGEIVGMSDFFDVTPSSNLCDPSTILLNHTANPYTGEIAESSNKAVSDFIPVEVGKTYIGAVYYGGKAYPSNATNPILYDENKNFIARGATSLGIGYTVDNANAKYMRACFNMLYDGTFYVTEGDTLPETFEPYIAEPVKLKEECLHITDDSRIDDGTISSAKLKPVEAEKLLPFVSAENLYNPEARIDGKRYVNGNLVDNANGAVSELIPAESGAVFTVGVLYRDAWYYASAKYAYCFDAAGKWLGQVNPTNGVFTTLEGTGFISFFIDYAAVSTFVYTACLVKGDRLPDTFTPYSGNRHRLDPVYLPVNPRTNWAGKKMVTYGDSITEQNTWQPYVRHLFGMVHANRGVGGSGFVRGVEFYWANADGSKHSTYTTGSTAPEGTTKCEAGFCSDQRIELSVPTDADLIIIAGGTNDHGGDATSAPEIGEISYTIDGQGNAVFDTSTFKNAVCATVYKIRKRCPNAIVLLATPVNTRIANQQPLVNGQGLTLADYAEAIKECATFMSVPCIDVFGESGLNPFNHTTYSDDGVHPNKEGGKLIARAVNAALKCYEPFDLVLS